MNKIQDSKFILSAFEKGGRYHTDRMSGVLPLSFNIGIPLITDEYIRNIYGLHNAGVLTYKKSLLEIIDTLITIESEKYNDLLKQQRDFKNKIYLQNKKELFNIINPHINNIEQYNGKTYNQINKDKNYIPITNNYGEIVMMDAVYTWVNMNDPIWIEKYVKYTNEKPNIHRFKDNGELEFSIKLLKKNCDFIRNIYIVTDNQIPSWLIKKRQSNIKSEKEWCKNIFIVDHKDIINHKSILPTFKSNTIESFLHNIDGLSEYFLYFNDDTFIGRKCDIDTFINKKTRKPYARMKNFSINNPLYYQYSNTYKDELFNTNILINRKYNKPSEYVSIHQVIVMSKKICYEAWKIFPSQLFKSATYKTRNPHRHTIHFTLLCQILGVFKNVYHLQMNNYNISHIFINQNRINVNNPVSTLQNIIKIKPHLLCINSVYLFPSNVFDTFKNEYLNS
jgi:hypothetical protein